MKLKVVGVLAYDSIISEFGKKENLFGGSATHFAISDSYLINLTLVLLLSTIIFGFFASFVGIRKVLND